MAKVKQSEKIEKQRLIDDLKKLGLTKGDNVFVHSSLSRIGYVEGGANTVIHALEQVVGENGTLIFPTFSFPNGGVISSLSDPEYIFDVNTTPSHVGKISEVFRKREGVLRSLHPTHSVAAKGPNAEYITKHHLDKGENWGKNSPFGKMYELNVKMIGLGVALPKFTFFHCVEDYRLDLFPDLYASDKMQSKVKVDNQIETFDVAYHNQSLTKHRIEKNPEVADYFTSYFLASNKLKKGLVGNAETLLIYAKDFFDLTVELAENNKTIYSL